MILEDRRSEVCEIANTVRVSKQRIWLHFSSFTQFGWHVVSWRLKNSLDDTFLVVLDAFVEK